MAYNTNKNIKMEGKLSKRGKINKSWKERWFVLNEDANTETLSLQYYSYLGIKNTNKELLGIIDLSLVERIETTSNTTINTNASQYIIINNKKKQNKQYSFELITPNRTYVLAADDKKTYCKWLTEISRIIYGEIVYQGVLKKQGQINKTWRVRYCVLNKFKQIKYYPTKQRQKLLGYINLIDAVIIRDNSRTYSLELEYTFEIATVKRTWVICAPTQLQKTEWIKHIESVINGNLKSKTMQKKQTNKKTKHHSRRKTDFEYKNININESNKVRKYRQKRHDSNTMVNQISDINRMGSHIPLFDPFS
eukprot:538519_1